jgi:hypothetical protein
MAGGTGLSAEVATYTIAIDDLYEASMVARLIADHDPDLEFARRIHEVGLNAAQAEAKAKTPSTTLGDFSLRTVIETGLIVTYARPFTQGRGSGFPLSARRFVPQAKQSLHDHLLSLRNKVYGHTDASAPTGFGRKVSWEVKPGVETEEWKRARLLTQSELREMADLADEIMERLRVARKTAASTTP